LIPEVTAAWAGHGYRVAPFEIKLNPLMDILSVPGFLNVTSSLEVCSFMGLSEMNLNLDCGKLFLFLSEREAQKTTGFLNTSNPLHNL